MAVELIIQLGDKEFWENHKEQIKCMDYIYRYILFKLQELVEGFKVANAVIHYDEASPHMHIVGVPIAEGFKKGLYKKVSKRSVFTQEVLTKVIQDELRTYAQIETIRYLGEEIRYKKQGRNQDLSVIEYKVHKENEKLEKIKQENYRLELDNEVLNHESDKAMEKAKIANELYKDMIVSGEGERFYREEAIELRYENEKLKEEVKGLKEMLDRVFEFMKGMVAGGRNMLDVFKDEMRTLVSKARNKERS